MNYCSKTKLKQIKQIFKIYQQNIKITINVYDCAGGTEREGEIIMMNKSEFVKVLAEKTGKSQKEMSENLDVILDTIVECAKANEAVKLIGFGIFEVAQRAARTGRNPQTGEDMEIAASKSFKLKVSQKVKERINA